MTNDPVRTILYTSQGRLAFQEYFVRDRWQPVVRHLEFSGIQQAQPSPGLLEAIEAAELIIFGPSNPFLSIDPILNVPGVRHQITLSSAPVLAVSPIVGGKAVKGPAAKLMNELGVDASPLGIAQYYEELLDGIILDSIDKHLISDIQSVGMKSVAKNTMMNSAADKTALAASILKWAEAF
jgi:LPPG:FO 2-phospho-L-lactate transferase